MILKNDLAGAYSRMSSHRDEWLDAARDYSSLTAAGVMPPEGRATPTNRIVPHNNLGASGVITLAAKLVMELLPPNRAFFLMTIRPEAGRDLAEGSRSTDEEQAAQAQKIKNEIQEGLVDLENRIVQQLGRGNLRANAHEVFLQLIVTGNVIFHVPSSGVTSVFDLRQFVVQRDPSGNVTHAIIEEELAEALLSDEQKDKINSSSPDMTTVSGADEIHKAPVAISGDKLVKLHTGIELLPNGKYGVWQEIKGVEVEGSYAEYEKDALPYMVLRWRPAAGEHYGHAYVADLEGDLRQMEGLSKALKEGALLSSKFFMGVAEDAPAGLEKKLSQGQHGKIHRFNADDVFIVQANKFADLQVTANALAAVEGRLKSAFLMNSTRQAERVTAEEKRQDFAELQSHFGGNFATFGNEFQAPLLQRVLRIMKEGGALAGLEDALKSTEPVIITGVDAIGRNAELNNLTDFAGTFQAAVGPQRAAQVINAQEMGARIANATSVNPSNLLVSQEEVSQAQNADAIREAGVKAAPAAAGAAINAQTQG